MEMKLTKDNVDVTKDEFDRYQEIRQDGQHNMFSPFAREEADLSKNQWVYIMRNFDDLIELYGDINNA